MLFLRAIESRPGKRVRHVLACFVIVSKAQFLYLHEKALRILFLGYRVFVDRIVLY